MTGEQCPIDEFSYMGYSPPKCICNDTHTSYHIPYRKCNRKCNISCHARDETPYAHNPSPDRLLTHANASVKPVIGVSPNDLTHLTTLQYLFNFTKSRVFCVCGLRQFLGLHRRIIARLFNIFTVFHYQ